jgi:hypothetical protein
MCQAVGTAWVLSGTFKGRLTNVAAAAVSVSCPFQKDVTGEQSVECAEIVVTNPNTVCRFHSRSETGPAVAVKRF